MKTRVPDPCLPHATGITVGTTRSAKGNGENMGTWFAPGSNKRPVACPHDRSTGIGYNESKAV
jgi:hypothetical protein